MKVIIFILILFFSLLCFVYQRDVEVEKIIGTYTEKCREAGGYVKVYIRRSGDMYCFNKDYTISVIPPDNFHK